MSNFQNALKSLNPKQLEAVEAIEGAVMVVAGPGTGKTYVLTVRIANILHKTDAKPANILALTFTDSAAKNMQQRLFKMIGKDAYKVKIETFHSFCNEIIQQYPDKFGMSSAASQITDLEKVRLIESIINSLDLEHLKPFNVPLLYKESVIKNISELKREGITPEEFKELLENAEQEFANNKKINPKTGKLTRASSDQEKLIKKNKELQQIYESYQKVLSEQEKYDYDDMILFVIEGFEHDDELLARFQEQYLYILIDEFQDTNGAQSKILELIGSFDDQPNIFVVGDDAQSIFRFQGASIENMFDFIKKYPKAKIINLEESYRCPADILKGAESLISQNRQSLQNIIPDAKRVLKSNSKITNTMEFYNFETVEQEIQYVVNQVDELLKKKIEPEEIAVIYRAHKDADLLKLLLTKKKIPANISDSKNILEEEYISKLLSLLRVIQDPYQDDELFKALNFDFFNIERLLIFKTARQSGIDGNKLFDSILESKHKNLKKFAEQIIEWKSLDQNKHFISFLENIINQSGLVDFLKKEHKVDSLRSLSELFTFLYNQTQGKQDYKLKNFLEDQITMIENRLSIDISHADQKDGISLLTAHKAKGLEFKHVFIIKMQEGHWSNKRIYNNLRLPEGILDTLENDSDSGIEEERRLLYVALTRTREKLILTFSNKSIENGKEKEHNESQFVNEIHTELLKKKKISEIKLDPELVLEPIQELNLIESEKTYLKSLLENYKLSYSALNLYLEDPQAFLYRNILHIPLPIERPMIVGSLIHKALEARNRDKKRGQEKESEFYVALMKKFIKLEFVTKEEAFEIMKEASSILESYFKEGIKDTNQIAEIEYNFFGHNVYLNNIGLTGKIDAIERIEKSGFSQIPAVNIVDYKTGSPKSRNYILGETKNSDGSLMRQLQFYKLLIELDDRFPYKPEQFELIFIKPNTSGKFKTEKFSVDEIQTDELKELIIQTMEKITSLEFAQ